MRIPNNNTEAVSPVIGVILMVAITVILAAVIAAFTFGIGSDTQKTPVAALVAQNNPDTQDPDLKIVHKGGDKLIRGGWKICIVPVGQARVFIGASTNDFMAGHQFSAKNTTVGASNLTSQGFEGGEPLVRGSRYDVAIIEYPSETLLFDDVVEVR